MDYTDFNYLTEWCNETLFSSLYKVLQEDDAVTFIQKDMPSICNGKYTNKTKFIGWHVEY